MPWLETWSGLRLVISLFWKIILPSSDFTIPETRLKIVDLPAPLGPIRAVIVPSLILKLAPSTALTPPNISLNFLFLTFYCLFLIFYYLNNSVFSLDHN